LWYLASELGEAFFKLKSSQVFKQSQQQQLVGLKFFTFSLNRR